MSTSIYKGLIHKPAESNSIGPSFTRDYVLNNLLHSADEISQPRIAMNVADSGYLEEPTCILYPLTFRKMFSAGTFRLPLRQNGAGYKLRVRLAGATSTSTEIVYFRIVVGPPALLATLANETDGTDARWTAATTSTSPAWLNGTTDGPAANSTILSISAAQISDWSLYAGKMDTTILADGTPVSVPGCEVEIAIFGRTNTNTRTPRLYASYAAEYVGL